MKYLGMLLLGMGVLCFAGAAFSTWPNPSPASPLTTRLVCLGLFFVWTSELIARWPS
jgi:hypothetical protein